MTSMASLPPLVLAIETSCDETAVAILRGKNEMLASGVSSQIALHRPHGGVVPEVASRSHLTQLRPLIGHALETAGLRVGEIDAFAATTGPGLASSLMIGVSAAKGLALSLRKPYLAVNHLEGHLLSPFFGREEGVTSCVALVVSGGHTLLVEIGGVGDYRVLGQTRDDAAGEAFDKVGKLLQLPYPGGPEIDRLAREGNPARFDFPRSMMHSGDFSFSFSGLKTAVRTMLPKLQGESMPDICASFQAAVVDVLVHKTMAAAKAVRKKRIAVSGGVSCNSRLREKFSEACGRGGIELLVAGPELCTDNAGMIAYVAAERLARGQSSPVTADIDPNLRLV
jgi:N6-L-threonylcarbamoyladenine synthase